MPTDKDEFFYFTLMDFKSAVEEWGDDVFSELEKSFPDIYVKLEAYLCNKKLERDFFDNQEEVL